MRPERTHVTLGLFHIHCVVVVTATDRERAGNRTRIRLGLVNVSGFHVIRNRVVEVANPLTGSAKWVGIMAGIDASGSVGLAGDAPNVLFENIRYLADMPRDDVSMSKGDSYLTGIRTGDMIGGAFHGSNQAGPIPANARGDRYMIPISFVNRFENDDVPASSPRCLETRNIEWRNTVSGNGFEILSAEQYGQDYVTPVLSPAPARW